MSVQFISPAAARKLDVAKLSKEIGFREGGCTEQFLLWACDDHDAKTITSVADELEIDPKSVRRAIKELRELGVLESSEKTTIRSTRSKRYVFRIIKTEL